MITSHQVPGRCLCLELDAWPPSLIAKQNPVDAIEIRLGLHNLEPGPSGNGRNICERKVLLLCRKMHLTHPIQSRNYAVFFLSDSSSTLS